MLSSYTSLSRTVHILCVGAFVNRAGSFVIPFLTLYLRKSLDLDVAFATTAMGVFGAGALAAALVGGQLADAIGRKRVMLISLFGPAILLMIFGMLKSPATILIAVGVFSFLSEMYRPAASAMVADVTDSLQRTHAFSLMYVAINLGYAVAVSVGGILADLSFQWLFWGDALTAAAYGFLILFFISETLPTRTTGASEAYGAEQLDAGIAAAVGHILRDGIFLVYCGGTFLLAMIFMQAMTTFPIFLSDLDFSMKQYGMIMAINGVLIVCAQLPVTTFVARYHRGWMMTLSTLIAAIGFGLFAVSVAPWHFAFAVVIWTIGEIMGAPLSSAIVSDLAPKQFRARYMGVYSMSYSASMMIGAPLGGWVLRDYGGAALWVSCGLVGLVSAAAFFVLRNRVLAPAASK